MNNSLRAATLASLFIVLLERGPVSVFAANPNVCGLGRLGRDLVRRASHDETARISNSSLEDR